MTKRKAIRTDVLAMLNAGGPPVPVEDSRTRAIDLTASKSMVLYSEKEDEPEPIGGNRFTASSVRRRYRMRVECRAKGTDTTTADDEVDELSGWVVKTVVGKQKGVNDGALYHLLVEGETQFQLDQQDHQYCLAIVEVIAEYQTPVNDPDTWG